MLVVLVSALVAVCYAQTEVTESIGTAFPTTMEPEILEFSIKLYHRESSTSTIDIIWRSKVPKWMVVDKYRVETTRLGSESVTISPDLPPSTDEFIVQDLVKDTKFDVCVIATIRNDTENAGEEYIQCMESFTIPYIRDDSLYVLAIVLGVILGLILIGYLSWRCAVAAAEKRAAGEEEEEEDEGKKSSETKPILLNPTANAYDRPKSSIEDEDIPFITPPWSEIEREERERKAAANNVA